MPLASAPVEIAGRNRMFRAMIIQAIRNDPERKGGEYTTAPVNGMIAAEYALWMMTSSPLRLQKANPTPGHADAAVTALRERAQYKWTRTICSTSSRLPATITRAAPRRDPGAAMGDQFGR
jgi:homoserine acetyltransferase